jgi:transposase InsO family protein
MNKKRTCGSALHMVFGVRNTRFLGPGTRTNTLLLRSHRCKHPSGVLRALGPWMNRGARTQIHVTRPRFSWFLYDVMIRGPCRDHGMSHTLCPDTYPSAKSNFTQKGSFVKNGDITDYLAEEQPNGISRPMEVPRRRIRVHKCRSKWTIPPST